MHEVLSKSYSYSIKTILAQSQIKCEAQKQRNDQIIQKCADLNTHLQPVQLKAVELAGERGASAWITTLPLKEFGFVLHKCAYRDALALRYGCPPQGLAITCVCGSHLSVQHALSCPRGTFPIIRHNEIRDLPASLLTEVCHDVSVKPELQPIDGESMPNTTANSSQGVRLDIAVNGFWGGVLNDPSLMCEFLILLPLATGICPSQSATEVMKTKRNVPMSRESEKWNTALSLPLSWLPLEA